MVLKTQLEIPILYERLSGNPHSGGYDRMLVADRLAGALPESEMSDRERKRLEALGYLF